MLPWCLEALSCLLLRVPLTHCSVASSQEEPRCHGLEREMQSGQPELLTVPEPHHLSECWLRALSAGHLCHLSPLVTSDKALPSEVLVLAFLVIMLIIQGKNEEQGPCRTVVVLRARMCSFKGRNTCQRGSAQPDTHQVEFKVYTQARLFCESLERVSSQKSNVYLRI